MYDQNINELIQVTTMEIRLLRRPPSNKDILLLLLLLTILYIKPYEKTTIEKETTFVAFAYLT